MSHQAIAAVLAMHDLSCGERLVAFSLASFADRDSRARPGTPAAAGRAGLKRSWFLEARDMLVRRELVVVEQAATGRGRASTLWLVFAETGPWWEGEVNAELLEIILSYSRSHGTARLLLAATAALADEQRLVEGVRTERLCAAAGVTDRTYRRARAALLSSGELVLRSGTGGRGKTNCWEIAAPRSPDAGVRPPSRRRVAPPSRQRPFLASVTAAPAAARPAGADVNPSQPVTRPNDRLEGNVSGDNRPVAARVSPRKDGAGRTLSSRNRPVTAGVSVGKGGADRTLSRRTPAKTPAETPAPNARAGTEPQNPRTHPPSPPEGGSGADQLLVEETYLTERGRRRRRPVAVDLAAVRERLRAAGAADLAAWEQIRALLQNAVGESTFEIWLERLELIAIDLEGALVVSAPAETRGWVVRRFGRVLDGAAQRAGRGLRVADEVERGAAEPLAAAARGAPGGASADGQSRPGGGAPGRAPDVQTALFRGPSSVGSRASRDDQSGRSGTYPSDYPSSCTDVYTQTREVS